MRTSIRIAALLAVLALLAGCEQFGGKPQFQLTDVTGAAFGRDFQLTDHNGQRRSLADFRGKVVAVFFGYTHCPDICPTAMAELAQVAQGLGPAADRLQVLFVTVDPERDTPALLKRYVPSFNPGFLGLYGDAETTARTAKEFKIFFQKQPVAGGDYTVDHSAGIYLYDTQGRLRLFASHNRGAEAVLHDVRILIKS